MKNNDKALVTFMDKIRNISEQLDELHEYINNCMNENPDDIHWGHVASAEKILSDIRNIMAFLGFREEAEE